MTLDTSDRVIPAGTWIDIQNKLKIWAAYISLLGLVGMVVTFLVGLTEFMLAIAAGTIVIPCTLVTLAWGLEAFSKEEDY